MIYIPILGAIALASGTIMQKILLRKRKMNIKEYNILEFLSIVIVMALVLVFFWKLEPEALQIKNILIFAGIVLISIVANLFMLYSIKWEKISNLEPAKILEPLFVVLIAIVFSFFFDGLYERDTRMIIPGIIAACALVFSHIRKHHLNFNKYFIFAVIGSFLFAFELVLSVLILNYYSPFTFYFLRCAAILLITYLMFRPKIDNINGKEKLHFLIIGIIWVVLRVIMYYGYLKIGIISTTIILLIGPVLVYAFARIFLKEKLHWKNVVASIIILACVAYVELF
jgi:drug/metabolite transporter (DMT)-like permease